MIQSNDSGLNLDHLEACPFCGSGKVKISGNGQSSFGYCTECEVEGPPDATPAAATETWNRRAALANQPAPTVLEPLSREYVQEVWRKCNRHLYAFAEAIRAHQPTQKQADETTPSLDHRNTHVLLYGYTAQQEPVAAPQQAPVRPAGYITPGQFKRLALGQVAEILPVESGGQGKTAVYFASQNEPVPERLFRTDDFGVEWEVTPEQAKTIDAARAAQLDGGQEGSGS